MVRSAFGVVVGAVAWMVAFFSLARLLFLVSTDYAVHARAWTAAQSYEFTAPESAFNALFWLLAAIFAGWLAAVIAKRREAYDDIRRVAQRCRLAAADPVYFAGQATGTNGAPITNQ